MWHFDLWSITMIILQYRRSIRWFIHKNKEMPTVTIPTCEVLMCFQHLFQSFVINLFICCPGKTLLIFPRRRALFIKERNIKSNRVKKTTPTNSI